MQPIVGFFCVVLSRRCSILGYYRPSFRPEAFLARCSLSTSSSPDEVDQQRYAKLQNDARDLVQRASFKVRGSAHHTKLRRRHITLFCDAVREGLIHRDGTLYNSTNDHQHRCDATKKLVADLGGIGANQGIMPDFSSPKALRGYALGHFGRAQLLSELVTQTEPDWLDERVSELFSVPSAPSSQQHAVKAGDRKDGEKEVTLASLGGGCGYDFVALAALSEYLGGPRIAATVYEYEPAWKEIVEDVESVVRDVFAGSQDPSHHTTITTENRSQRPTHECGFEFCDITSPLNSSSNEALASEIHSIQVFSCSYVVAENAVKLQQNGFVFFSTTLCRGNGREPLPVHGNHPPPLARLYRFGAMPQCMRCRQRWSIDSSHHPAHSTRQKRLAAGPSQKLYGWERRGLCWPNDETRERALRTIQERQHRPSIPPRSGMETRCTESARCKVAAHGGNERF
mmetsp:Transcript_6833/g.16161  ORF Transcript_6833/g.16161 Transcript_6833/m.16161 type:complete len:456 (-) Transcript_6833:1532-2899(-)